MSSLTITPLPFARDNYIWLIDDGRQAVFVDPGEAAPVIAVLDERALIPLAILLTHHHDDHTGGVAAILARYPGLPVHGPRKEDIPGVDHPVDDGDRIVIPGFGMDFIVLGVAAHTRGHIAYLGVEPLVKLALFCGDALFSAGCGRLFEGTVTDLEHALDRLARLPPNTLVYCAHEYTLANLAFSHAVEPKNTARDSYEARCLRLRAEGRPTLPSTIATELDINPFLRCMERSIRNAIDMGTGNRPANARACLAALRAWKDKF
ncbi:MAG: hydroxyacylglutathione hydrolase [Azoarcus sp.]|jgi:hydroxyacylglutathione hydrolase|nr:hydroxyacylglutathione hydrolase [Azoarcus sp.]